MVQSWFGATLIISDVDDVLQICEHGSGVCAIRPTWFSGPGNPEGSYVNLVMNGRFDWTLFFSVCCEKNLASGTCGAWKEHSGLSPNTFLKLEDVASEMRPHACITVSQTAQIRHKHGIDFAQNALKRSLTRHLSHAHPRRGRSGAESTPKRSQRTHSDLPHL